MLPDLQPINPRRITAAARALQREPVDQAHDLVEHTAVERIALSERRQHRTGPHTLRCGICHRYVVSLGTRCGSCGNWPNGRLA